MAAKIEIFSDYLCPWCYVALQILDEIKRRKSVEVEYKPYQMRPEGVEKPRDLNKVKEYWESTLIPKAKEMGVDLKLPWIEDPRSYLAFEATLYAEEQGMKEAFYRRVMEAYFQEGLDINDPQVLVRIGAELGLDGEELSTALASRRYKETFLERLEEHRERGVSYVPTIFVNGVKVEGGIYPLETMLEIIERIEKGEPFQELLQ